MTRPSRESAGWQPAQSAYGSSGWHARPARYARSARWSRGRRRLGGGQQARVADAQRVEERAVRILRPVGERARERVDEDERPAVSDRERVAPLPEREPEYDGGRRDRVERLAGHVRTRPTGRRRRSRRAARRGASREARPLERAPRRARPTACRRRRRSLRATRLWSLRMPRRTAPGSSE